MTYAGDLTPEQAFNLLQDESAAVLVDVRTAAEWTYVGLPDLTEAGKQPITIEWVSYPGGEVNAAFLDQLAEAGAATDAPVIFLCRSGARSVSAAEAATAAGYTKAYNVLHGFEGAPDAQLHRGKLNGWKASELPWRQQ